MSKHSKTLLASGVSALGIASVIMAFTLDSYSLLVFSFFALTVVVGVGLNILIGLSGQISFGHIAFYAIGAYVSALLTMQGISLWLALPAAGLVCAIAGGLLAIPALRVNGPYLAMITIAFALVVHHGLVEWRSLTGGANGLMGIPMPSLGDTDPAVLLALISTALMLGALVFFQLLRNSGWGRAMRAVKASEIAARSLGFNPVQTKTLAFALSALLTGMAGAVVSPLMMFINPASFPFTQSILFVLAVIVGGAGTVLGPVLGALLIVLLPEALSGAAEYRLLIFSGLLLGVLWVAPRGVLGSAARLWLKPVQQPAPVQPDLDQLSAFFADTPSSKGLEVKDISIRFGGVQAAKDVSFSAPPGSITSIIGPNGAGKTTVLNMISGFYAPNSGSIKLDTEVAGSVNSLADELPHVDRRLVEIARALASRPRVLLLDEPAAGLGQQDTQQLAALFHTLAGYGIAVILVEHDMTLVMAVSERILVLDAGRPIAWGSASEVRQDKRVIAAYLGGTSYQATPREQPWKGSRDARLYIKDLVLDYGAAPVVNKVNLVVNPGELIAILGANGAGKSSILQSLAGLHPATSGSILLDDESIHHLDASQIAARGLALVPEGRQMFPQLSVRDNLMLGAFSRTDKVDADAEIEAILRRFPRLRDRIDSPAGLLSGGEQQMVAVGRGLMAKPKILLLDEPSLGLSPAMIGELYDALAALRDEGVTLLLVDQMANLALQVADRAYVLETGRIVKSGTAEELRGDSALEAAYLGEGAVA